MFLKRDILKATNLLYESRRFRAKINLKRPQLPHFQRKLVLDVCKPQLPEKPRFWEVCQSANSKRKKIVKQENPFEDILAKECLNWFDHSGMVAFCHTNPISLEEKFPTIQNLAFENMFVRRYGKKIVIKALTGTNYEPCITLFAGHTEMIFSETVKVKKLLDILKKTPQLVLMAGLVHGKLLSKNEFVEYSNLPSIDVLQSQVCNVLQSAGSSIVQQLSLHKASIVSSLDQYIKIQQENEKKTSSDESQLNPGE